MPASSDDNHPTNDHCSKENPIICNPVNITAPSSLSSSLSQSLITKISGNLDESQQLISPTTTHTVSRLTSSNTTENGFVVVQKSEKKKRLKCLMVP